MEHLEVTAITKKGGRPTMRTFCVLPTWWTLWQNPWVLTWWLLMALLMTRYVFKRSWGFPSSLSLLASFASSLPLSLFLVLSLSFLFNYLMSPLQAQTPIEMWAALSALSRLCTSDLWSLLFLTVCMHFVCTSPHKTYSFGRWNEDQMQSTIQLL